jgi:hypothetical protein
MAPDSTCVGLAPDPQLDTNIKVNVVNLGLRDTEIAGTPMPGAGDPAGGATHIVEMALGVRRWAHWNVPRR